MNDRRLLALSLCLSLIGVTALAVGVSLQEPRIVSVADLDRQSDGEYVSVTGIAQNVAFRNGNLFFTLSDGESIRVVVFSETLERQDFYGSDLVEGASLRVEGRPKLYKGNMELVAQRVTLL